jgi:hypothetical protein
MTICTRCATSEWHPEVRTCAFGDCPFRAEIPAAANDELVTVGNTEIERPRGLIAAAN